MRLCEAGHTTPKPKPGQHEREAGHRQRRGERQQHVAGHQQHERASRTRRAPDPVDERPAGPDHEEADQRREPEQQPHVASAKPRTSWR